MDPIDTEISLLLLQNSRMRYRNLAKSVGLSVNAVHKRVQSMISDGIIRKFKTQISLKGLKAQEFLIFGDSESDNLLSLSQKLGSSEEIFWVSLVGTNTLYIGGYLKKIEDLENVISFVRKEGAIEKPTIGVVNNLRPSPPYNDQLLKYDYQILSSLKEDSRKPISQIAEEANLSSKTVNYHLKKMKQNNWIEFTIDWYPERANDIIALFHIKTKPSNNRMLVGNEIVKEFFPRALFYWTFSNLPDLLIIATWNPTMQDLQDLRSNIEKKGFQSVSFNITYKGDVYNSWRDTIIEEMLMKK